MIHWLARVYRRVGIHSAPPGTLLYWMHSRVHRIVRRKGLRYSTVETSNTGKFGAMRYYDITRMRQTRAVDGIALVFFMGAGDYLMATPMIQALHLAHPDLPIYAYGSSHTDSVNSSLVIGLLQANPLIDRVFTYRGRPGQVWRDYDFQDALKDIPPGFVTVPVMYDVEPTVFHRTTSILETFNLPIRFPLPRPIAYPTKLSPAGAAILDSIQRRIAEVGAKSVVLTHFGARSSGYEYPHGAELVNKLVRSGAVVVSFSPTGVLDDGVIDIDVATLTPSDSIEVLRALKKSAPTLSLISVNSIMWPISAALDIPNLGMHVFRDPSMHQYLYPNIAVITPHLLPRLPPYQLFLAPPGAYRPRSSADNATIFADYNPQYILESFEAMRSPTAEQHD